MTIAMCIECGKEKFGAFSPCDRCGFEPTSIIEQAKSVLLSDHHQSRGELKKVGKIIESGQPITYDPNVLALNVRVFERMEADPTAFECTMCGETLDSFDETVCPTCKRRNEAGTAKETRED